VASGGGALFPDKRNLIVYRKYIWYTVLVLAIKEVGGYSVSMTPQQKKTTTESIEIYRETLREKNFSVLSIKAYLGDLQQFLEWLKKRRVDWDIPYRIQRIDIVEFINFLEAQKATAETRKRKLAAIRSFLKFLKDNQIIFGNPAETVEGPIREEKEPAILLKTEYKALLQVAGDNPRNFAIVMLFLQSGLRVSELVNLKVQDVDFISKEITVRQGKGRRDRVVPLVGQAIDPLKAYLAVREANPEYDNVFIARNGTSMDVRTVRYAIHKCDCSGLVRTQKFSEKGKAPPTLIET
jgi:integrase/recombinase XerC